MAKKQTKRLRCSVSFLVASVLRLALALPPQRLSGLPKIPTQFPSLPNVAHNVTAANNNNIPKRRKKRQKGRAESVEDESVGSGRIHSEDSPSNGKTSTDASAGQLKQNEKVELCEKKPDSKVKRKELSGGREADLLRRVKREWCDAVKLGIAYDWMKMQTKKSSDAVESDKYKYVRIGPLGKNLLQWHFSVMGPPNSEYEGGIYHGRVLLPKDYPASPPRIQVLTPSGRFITGEDICLSASSFHPESWTPRWTVLSLVDALRLHMLTTANEIGGKDATPDERRRYARASRQWHHGRIDHRVMVQDGIFPWHDETDEMRADVMLEKEGDGSIQMAARRTPEARIRKHHSQSSKLLSVLVHAVVEVLTSPPCLALVLILTVFVILSRR